jgi:hypothetical protein
MTNDRQEPRLERRLVLARLITGLALSACQESDSTPHALGIESAPPAEQGAAVGTGTEELLAEPLTDTGSVDARDLDAGLELDAVPEPGLDSTGELDLAPVAEPAEAPEPRIASADDAVESLAMPELPEPAKPEPTRSLPEEPAPTPAPQVTEPEPAPTVAVQSEPEPLVEEPVVEAEPEPAVVAPAPTTARSTSAGPTLNLETLETQLRKTKAIGLFTKLELKNEVGDLVKDVDNYHRNRSQLSLTELEERFDLLVMKLLLLLQDGDPPLHQMIADARPALWTTLADPDQFATVKGT